MMDYSGWIDFIPQKIGVSPIFVSLFSCARCCCCFAKNRAFIPVQHINIVSMGRDAEAEREREKNAMLHDPNRKIRWISVLKQLS